MSNASRGDRQLNEREDEEWYDTDEDEKEADSAIREMEDRLGACLGENDKTKQGDNKASPGTGTSSSNQAGKPEESSAPTAPAAASAAAGGATATEATEALAGLLSNTVKELAKTFERTLELVQMPTASLPNANTATLWMSQMAAPLSLSSVF